MYLVLIVELYVCLAVVRQPKVASGLGLLGLEGFVPSLEPNNLWDNWRGICEKVLSDISEI